MMRFLLRLSAAALAACVLLFALGPLGVRQYRLWRDDQAVSAYRDAVDALDDVDCGALRSRAARHNDALSGGAIADPLSAMARVAPGEADGDIPDPAGNGVMAVLEVPKLGATLPVYSGAARAASDRWVCHAVGSSLPLSGAGSPCVLAARSDGWVSGPFAGLDRLLPGDCFTLRMLRDAPVYEVTQVSVVAPDELQGLGDGADTCVLMTAVRRDGQDRRLVVRGRRVARSEATPRDDTQEVPPWPSRLLFAVPVAVAGLAMIWLVEGIRRMARRHRARRVRI